MAEDKGCPPSCNYFKVKNDWWEAIIRYGLPMRERQCLDWIIRMTYGWQKKEAEISMADFVSATNIAAPNVSRCLKLLKYKRIINVDKKPGNRQVTYSFNKYFNQWRNPEVITDDNFAEVITDDNLKLSPVITNVITSDNKLDSTPIIVKDNINTIKNNSNNKSEVIKNDNFKIIPDWLDKQVWAEYKKYRQTGKNKFTPYAQKLAITKLGKLRDEGNNPEEVINRSIECGWTGLFPLKENNAGKTKNYDHLNWRDKIKEEG